MRALWESFKARFFYTRVRTPTVIQMEAVECGAASLGIILAYFKRYVPLEELREKCGVTKDGSNAASLLEAAEAYGLQCEGYKCSPEEVLTLPLPIIVFWNYNHFLVVEGYNSKWIYLNDPAIGPRKVPHNEFNKSFADIALTFTPDTKFVKGGQPPSFFPILKRRLTNVKAAVALTCFVGIFLLIPGIGVPLVNQIFYNNVLEAHQLTWMPGIIAGLVAAIVIVGLLTWIQQFTLNRLHLTLNIRSNAEFLWRLLRLPILFFSQRFSGEIASRFGLNKSVMQTLAGTLPSTAINFCLAALYLFVIFYYDNQIGLLALVTAGCSITLLIFVTRARTDAYAAVQQQYMKSVGFAVSTLRTIENIKAAGNERDVFARWSGYYALQTNAEKQINEKDVILSSVPNFINGLAGAALLGLGSWKILNGNLSIGMLLALQGFFTQLLSPVSQMIFLSNTIQTMKINAMRVDDALQNKLDPTFIETDHKKELAIADTRITGTLEVKHITFGFSKIDPPIINDFSLKARPGEKIAIIGRSGSGKSVLLKLIAGFFQPWQGEVLIDGKPRSAYSKSLLQHSIGYIDNSTFFFEGTIHDNLKMWNNTLNDEDMMGAAKDACIHEDIMARPSGYETKMTEAGTNFSGGQRQRLEMARTLLLNPSILITDGAVSALDAHTEQEISANIRKRGCTHIFVAQRISTVQHADQIIVLDGGKIVQQGNHNTLVKQDGLYRELAQQEEGAEQG